MQWGNDGCGEDFHVSPSWASLPTGTEGKGGGIAHSENMVSVLICGRSGTGKSTITKAIFDSVFKHQKKKKKIYAINDVDPKSPYEKIDWPALDTLTNCGVLIEDLIRATEKQRGRLQQLLSFSCSHNAVNPIVCIIHSINGNNIFGLLQLFRLIYIAASPSSYSSLINVMRHFNYDKSEMQALGDQLKNLKTPFLHYVIDVGSRSIHLTSSKEDQKLTLDKTKAAQAAAATAAAAATTGVGADALAGGTADDASKEASRLKARETATRFLSLLPERDVALAIFDLVYPALPLDRFNAATMTLGLLKGRDEFVVSLIDYIAMVASPVAALTVAVDDDNKEAEHSLPSLVKFHNYLRRKGVRLPRVFILNPAFR